MLNDRIQTWLIQEGKTRAEFAELLHISPRTVEGWLGKKQRPIPRKMHEAIEQIIAPAFEPGCIAVNVTFTDEQWEEITKDMPETADKKKLVVERMLAFIRAARLPGE